MRFASRQDAGRQLGQHLRKQGVEVDLVLGLPRGGVVVAAEVARRLQRPLDVLVVRKIGHPWQREFAVGALAEPDVVIFDQAQRWRKFRRRAVNWIKWWRRKWPDCASTARIFTVPHSPVLQDKSVLLVDDGLATGATAEAAVLSAKRQEARRIDDGRAGGLDQRGRTVAARGG